jgi:glycosyltransferase involved in cell wall biosynthesis
MEKNVTTVDIAIFAHNEEARIAAMISELAQQTVFTNSRFSARLLVLANGCQDATCDVAKASAQKFPNPDAVEVCDLKEGGKSRTWNIFVHQLSRPAADILVFLDADIGLPQHSEIANLIEFLDRRPYIQATSSLPIKDFEYYRTQLGLIERMISAGGRTSGHNLRTAICGQLYAMRSSAARVIKLPIGLPVEDGFVRHAIITALFSEPENESRIDQPENVIHVYPSERKISSLLKHQIRIVIGSSINAALFAHFIKLNNSGAKDQVARELAKAAQSAAWLPGALQELLPNSGFGWVPWPWLFARTYSFVRNGPYTPRRTLVAMLGFGMDLVVYIAAQFKMARGTGAGHW